MDKEKITLFKAAGMFLGMLGIAVISINGQAFRDINILSPLLALMSAGLYGLYTVVAEGHLQKSEALK